MKKIPYRPIITHDVDRYYKWKNARSILGEYRRILRRESSWGLVETLISFSKRNQKDPFSNLLEIAEMDLKSGLQSVFYIMTTQEEHPTNINDYNVEDKEVEIVLRQLLELGAEIGLHTGILTFDDAERMKEQKKRLETVIDTKVVRSRQHYLKYEYPTTFEILESIGIQNDSSILVELATEEREKATTYTMLDDDGNSMGLTQTPLVFMDTHHMLLKDDVILAILEESLAPAKENGGEVMVLWHNNNISNDREKGLYREALQVILNE